MSVAELTGSPLNGCNLFSFQISKMKIFLLGKIWYRFVVMKRFDCFQPFCVPIMGWHAFAFHFDSAFVENNKLTVLFFDRKLIISPQIHLTDSVFR